MSLGRTAGFLSLFLSTCLQATTPGSSFESNFIREISKFQKVIRLKSAKQKPNVRKLIKKYKGRIVVEGSQFFAVQPIKRKDRTTFYKALASHKKEFSLSTDPIVILRESHLSSLREVRTHDVAVDSDEATYFSAEEEAPCTATSDKIECREKVETESEKCQLTRHCGDKNPSWVRLATGADIVDSEIEKLWNEKGRDPKYLPRVAVVDTGFDKEGNESLLNSVGPIEYGGRLNCNDNKKAGIGPADQDEVGHGTAVTGVIAGKEFGITKFARMSVYRATPPNAGKATSVSYLSATIEEACKCNDIVNVSMGTLYDEFGLEPSILDETLEKVQRAGCLVLQSAGNMGALIGTGSGYVRKNNVPRVRAHNESGKVSHFSTSGNLASFGQGVYSLVAKGIQRKVGSLTCCEFETSAIKTNRGTSFATPIMTGIAAQIFAMLNLRGELPSEKDGLRRLLVLEERLGAISNSISGPGARGLTSAIPAIRTKPNQEAIEKALKTFPERNFGSIWKDTEDSRIKDKRPPPSPLPSICNSENCKDREACLREIRERILMNEDLSKGDINLTLKLLKEMGEKELELLLTGSFPNLLYSSELNPKNARLEEKWREFVTPKGDKIKKSKLIEAIDLLGGTIWMGRRNDAGLANKLRQILNSEGVTELLNHSELLGSGLPLQDLAPHDAQAVVREGIDENVSDVLAQVLSQLYDTEREEILNEIKGVVPGKSRHPAYAALLASQLSPWLGATNPFLDAAREFNQQWRYGSDRVPEVLSKPHLYMTLIKEMLPEEEWQKQQKVLEDEVNASISQKNLNLIALAIAHPDWIGRFRIIIGKTSFVTPSQKTLGYEPEPLDQKKFDFLKRFVESPIPNVDKKDYSALLARALHLLMVDYGSVLYHVEAKYRQKSHIGDYNEPISTSPEYVKRVLVPLLLNNPYAVLPPNAVSSGSLNANQATLSENDFFPQFIETQLSRATQRLTGGTKNKGTTNEPPAGIEMQNLLTALTNNAFIDHHDVKDYFNRAPKPNFSNLLQVSVSNVLRNPKIGIEEITQNPSFMTLQRVLEMPGVFLDPSMKEQFLGLLRPLKEDMEKPNRTYPAKFKSLLLKLFC